MLLLWSAVVGAQQLSLSANGGSGQVAVPAGQPVGSSAEAPAFEQVLQGLTERKFRVIEQAVTAVERSGDPRALSVLTAMLARQLYYTKGEKRLVIVVKRDGQRVVTDVVRGAVVSDLSPRQLKKVRLNNRLRRMLRAAIARLNVFSEDRNTRLAAVEQMMDSMNAASEAVLRRAVTTETDDDIRDAMYTALALADIHSPEKSARLRAVSVLSQSLHPAARAALAGLVSPSGSGDAPDTDPEIRRAAQRALQAIDARLQWYEFIETLFFGVSLGSVLLLAAIGLAITFGVMGVINMAHGELIMLGAYTTFVVQEYLMPDYIDASLFVAVPLAFVVSALVGILIERGVIRHLYGRPLDTLLATFGISLILQQTVRSIFSPLNQSVETPGWMSGSWEINSALSLTFNRLYIIVFSLLVFVALVILLKKTVFGLQMRAVTQNRPMARAMGIRSTWVDALTFGLGSGIAGVAGVALSQLTNVGPNLGQSYIIDSFMVVVFGGVGNLWGTLVGAMSLGVVNKFLEPWSGAVLAKILVLVFIILFIQKRPRGLFPQRGRAAEN